MEKSSSEKGKISRMVHRGFGLIRRQQTPFKINLLKNMIQNFSLSLTQQYQSIYITDLGASPVELGYVNSGGGVASALVSLPLGWLATKHGIKKIFITGLLLMILGSTVFALSRNWEITFIALIIFMLSQRIVMTGCPLVCGHTLSNEERATGMQLCDTLSAVPRLVAPIVAAFVISMFGGLNAEGIRPLYWIRSLGLSISLFLIFRFFTNPSGIEHKARQSSLMGDLRRVFSEGKIVKRWIILATLSTFPMYMGDIFIPLYAAQMKGANELILGWMFAASWLLVIPLALPIGRLADVFGRAKLILLMTPIYCTSLLLLIFAWNTPSLIASGLFKGFYMLMAVTQAAMTAELVPKELLGNWLGMLGLFRGIVGVVSPILGGIIWENIGPEYVFYFLISTQVARILILFTVLSSDKKKSETVEK